MKTIHEIYLVSDSTGETLERIFMALKAQFEDFEYNIHQFSFTRTENQISSILNDAKKKKDSIILYTIVDNNFAEFPDAITLRGTKHLKELINAKKKGYKSYILYLIQRNDCKFFKIAKDIDQEYKKAFDEALNSGVEILCYDCKLTDEEIKINNQIFYEK